MAEILDMSQSVHGRCEQLLPWFVNGTLTADERALVEGHVADCARCEKELARLRVIALEVREMEVDPACDRAFAHLVSRLEGDGVATGPAIARQPWWRSARGLQALAASQALLIVLGAAWIVRDEAPVGDSFRTLSDAPKASGARMFVTFDARVPEQEIRAAVLAAGSRVVDGPTPDGLYVLEAPARQEARALEVLRQSAAVARVDPLPAP